MGKKEVIKEHFEECGEVILHSRCGDQLEIHLHDTELKDNHVLVDKGEERHVLFYSDISAVDVHESGWE